MLQEKKLNPLIKKIRRNKSFLEQDLNGWISNKGVKSVIKKDIISKNFYKRRQKWLNLLLRKSKPIDSPMKED